MAPDPNAIVPIVSFKEIPRSDWKRLPELITSGFIGGANVVVCTHLDQVSQENMDEQLRALTKTPWLKGVLNANRVIPCFSRICSTDPILPNFRSRPFGIRVLWVIIYIDHCSQ